MCFSAVWGYIHIIIKVTTLWLVIIIFLCCGYDGNFNAYLYLNNTNETMILGCLKVNFYIWYTGVHSQHSKYNFFLINDHLRILKCNLLIENIRKFQTFEINFLCRIYTTHILSQPPYYYYNQQIKDKITKFVFNHFLLLLLFKSTNLINVPSSFFVLLYVGTAINFY